MSRKRQDRPENGEKPHTHTQRPAPTPRRRQQPAPGKVTRTSKLPDAQGPAVQHHVRRTGVDVTAPQVRSLWDHTIDPWMDAAHRGVPHPDDTSQAPSVQAEGNMETREPERVHYAAAAGITGTGGSLPHLEQIQKSFGPAYDLSGVRAHIGGDATEASDAMGAEAYATGNHVAFRASPDLHTAAHEAAHIVQQRAGVQLLGGVGQVDDEYERHANAVADLVTRGQSAEQELAKLAPLDTPAVQSHDVQANAVQMDPVKGGLTVARRLMMWLGRESVKKQISKHVAKHGRRISGKTIHTIFRNPNKIRGLVRKAGQEAVELAAANSKKPASEVLSGAGIRMYRQAVGSGKYRWIIEREFKNAIGKSGERVLKIVVDLSGRVVSAYPVGRFTALGLSMAAMHVFDAKAADAGERIQDIVTADAQRREMQEISWSEFVIDFILPLGFGVSSANEGEALDLAIYDIEQETYRELIAGIENEEQRSLASEEKRELHRLLMSSVGAAMVSQEAGDGEDGDVE